MNKIKLNLESLRVDTFSTQAAGRGQGTVIANAKTYLDTCGACPSAIDDCPSVWPRTMPCNGCVDTDFC
jgi:hypothetical protein